MGIEKVGCGGVALGWFGEAGMHRFGEVESP